MKPPNISINHPNHNEYTPRNISIGKDGEGMCIYVGEKYIPIELEHNDLENDYTNQHGADLWNSKYDLIIEVKNLSGTYSLDMKWIKALHNKYRNHKIKVLLASVIMSEKGKEYLRSMGWFVVEWGDQIIGREWTNAIATIHRNPDFVKLRKRLKKIKEREIKRNWVKPKTRIKNNEAVSSLIDYCVVKPVVDTQDRPVNSELVGKSRLKDKHTWLGVIVFGKFPR